ncbi:MAG: hypothetical protein RJA13_2198, partial [Bacteroidota bacterium]
FGMTENEACIFLGMQKGEDAFEAFEESLFQFKKFFTSQPIIRATFLAKLKKVEKVEEAALFFGIETPEIPFEFEFEWSQAKEMLFVFQSFQAIKSQLFLAVQDSKSCAHLKLVIHTLLDLNLRYIQLWPEIKAQDTTVVIAKEKDPMELLTDLQKLKERGIETFFDLSNTKDLAGNSIGYESQRLYLLHNKEEEWKTISLGI